MTAEPFLQPKGGYRKLRVYKTTEIIYDITFYFTSRYLKKPNRSHRPDGSGGAVGQTEYRGG